MSQGSIEQAMQLAIQNHQAGRLAEAEKIYRQVLTRQPGNPNALHLLGVIAAQLRQSDAAIDLIRRAITINPGAADYHNNLANALRDKGLLDEAAAAYRQAIRLKPNYVVAYNNLGNALCDLGQLDEGITVYHHALGLEPGHAGVHNNLGKALRDKGLVDKAVAALCEAIRLKPDYAEAHHNLSLVLLLKGDFVQGWPEHEWRWRLKSVDPRRHEFVQPQWDGTDLNGRTILLHPEQGMGDTIQFVRYVPMVANRGGKVVLQCQEQLLRLMQGLPGVEQLISIDLPPPPFDVHCPLMSLPLAFGTRMETIPAASRYLNIDGDLSRQWAARVANSTGLKVGIVWAGRAGYANDRNRSLPLSLLGPLGKVAGLTFFSLQKGEAAKQASPRGMELIDHTAELNDFTDTAALIANLDLVIAVDTAVAHLAGAMGKPVWVLLAYAPDWRWLLHRHDSPWYPTMRLFRQRSLGDWAEVVERVALALGEFRARGNHV
jgi:Flp pilus assembly protein TadD